MVHFKYIFSLTLLLSTPMFAHAAVTVAARFNPATVALGDKAQYTISIKQTSKQGRPETQPITSLPIPQTGGLTLTNGRVSTSQQTTIVNFETEHSVTQTVIIEASAPRIGTYTVPSFTFTYDGSTYTAPSSTLQVVERPEGAPPPVDKLLFLQVDAPNSLYIGQSAHCSLKLYIHEQVRYRSLNDFNRKTDGFTVSELPEGEESIERIGNFSYQVITWPLVITPIQAGSQHLNFELAVIADVPTQRNQRDPLGRRSPLGGSFFNDFFSARSERFNLINQPKVIEVLPLPEKGKTNSFSGAIGDFSIKVTNDANDSRVGEPIMLSLLVSGAGNFNRIEAPNIPETPVWRSYEPEAKLEVSPNNPLKGVKRFDYVFIPQQAGKQMLPEIEFSFFDPDEKKYVSLRTPPMKVDVGPSLQPQTTVPKSMQTVQTIDPLDARSQLSPEEALLTLDYRPEPAVDTGFAILTHPVFYVANALFLGGFLALGFALRRRHRLATDTAFAKLHTAKAELKQALSSAKAAESAQDMDAFYRSAQDAVRLATSVRCKQNLRAAELDQLKSALQESNVEATTLQAVSELFNQANALRFSGGPSNSVQLGTARQQLNSILKTL